MDGLYVIMPSLDTGWWLFVALLDFSNIIVYYLEQGAPQLLLYFQLEYPGYTPSRSCPMQKIVQSSRHKDTFYLYAISLTATLPLRYQSTTHRSYNQQEP